MRQAASLIAVIALTVVCLGLLRRSVPGPARRETSTSVQVAPPSTPAPARTPARTPVPSNPGSLEDFRVGDERAAPAPPVADVSRIRITEIGAANRGTVLDESGKTPDWIELHNPGDFAVSLAGASLSLHPAPAGRSPWVLPAVTIAPGGYLVVWASGENRRSISSRALASATEIAFRETLIRIGDRWRYRIGDARGGNLSWSPVPTDWASPDFADADWDTGPSGFGYDDGDDATLVPEGTTSVFIRRRFHVEDPGRLGGLVLRIDHDDGFVAYLNGTRVASANAPTTHPLPGAVATGKREAGKAEIFDLGPHVHLLRPGSNVIAIVGLNDSPSSDMSLLPELGALAFVCHTDFRLPVSGGDVVFRDPAGTELDRVTYPALADDRSWGRRSDRAVTDGAAVESPNTWAYCVLPTPGEPNHTRFHRALPAASFRLDPLPGRFPRDAEIRAVVESASPGVRIGLSTDLLAPRSPEDDVPVSVRVEDDLLVRAAAFIDGEPLSPVVAATYLRVPPEHLPLLSISMDPSEFRRVQLGINEHGRAHESRAYLEVFAPGGERVVATGVGFRLHGGYGRRGGFETKKSYRLYFRRFHGDSFLQHPLIPDVPVEALRRVVLRANFNDRLGAYAAGASFIRDQVLRDLHRDLGAPVAAGAWCVVRINLEFRGIYNAVERLDERFLERHLGGASWDMMKTGDEVVCGSRDAWDELRDLVAGRRHGRPPTLAEIEREVDVENFTGYLLLNLWSQNQDWPQNNWYAARRRPRTLDGVDTPTEPGELASPSRWVFLSWDAEWGLGLNPTGWSAESFEFIARKQGLLRDVFAALWSHAEYRARFREATVQALDGPLSAQNVEATVDRHAARLRPLIAEELRALAPGASVQQWERNVAVVREFARRRAPLFLRSVERAARSPLPGTGRP